jgi:DNA-binding NtrC family response regulator
LASTSGNRTQAADQLGTGVRTLYDKLKRYGMT